MAQDPGERPPVAGESLLPRGHADSDHVLAGAVAELAGDALLALRARAAQKEASRWSLRDEADRHAEQVIARALREARPHDAVLSEEAVDGPARLDAERVWIVDPLDGTREFAEPGRRDWAVHVALWERGVLAAGAVALPAERLVLRTGTAPAPLPPIPVPPRVLVSRSRPHPVVEEVAAMLGAALVPMGSAGAKAMAVVRGQAEVYVHAGGQYEWDSAAPVAVAAAAGLHTSRLDGSPLRYNCPDPWLPDLVICRPELAEAVLSAV